MIRTAFVSAPLTEGNTHNSQSPVNPPIPNPQRHEPKDERRHGDPQRDKHGPHTHASRALTLEESLLHHGTPYRRRGTDKERSNRPAKPHSRVRRGTRTPDIAHETTHQGNHEHRATAVFIRQRPPEQGGHAQDAYHERGEVGGLLDGDVEVLGYVLEGRLDRGRREGGHEGVEGDQKEVDVLLVARPVVRVRVGGVGERVELGGAVARGEILCVC